MLHMQKIMKKSQKSEKSEKKWKKEGFGNRIFCVFFTFFFFKKEDLGIGFLTFFAKSQKVKKSEKRTIFGQNPLLKCPKMVLFLVLWRTCTKVVQGPLALKIGDL